MTIEDLPESVRCPDCGTWLPQEALACPGCGRPRDLQMSGASPRFSLPRWAIAGFGAGGVLVLGAAALFLLGPRGEPEHGPSPSQVPSEVAVATASPSPRPSPKSRPSPTPAASSSIEPSSTPLPPPVARTQLILPASILDLGPRALVQVQNLRVRQGIGLDSPIQVQLGLGSELLLRLGPVSADGYDWFFVYYPPLVGEPSFDEGGGSGWVASGPADSPPTFIAVSPSRCPVVPVTIALIASMSELARTDCLGTQAYEFNGVVETCYEGPLTPYRYEPAWLGFSCWYVYELGANVWLPLYISPVVSLPETFARGDVIRFVGHVSDPAAATCDLVAMEPVDAAQLERDRQVFRLECQAAFVADVIEVTGHINLPDPFGP